MADELSTPLVSKTQRRRLSVRSHLPRHWPWTRLLIGVFGLVVIAALARMMLVEDPEGGRPSAEAEISSNRQENAIAGKVSTAVQAPADGTTITPLTEGDHGPAITTVGEEMPAEDAPGASAKTAALEADETGIVPDLVEDTQHGPIPRMGTQGQTPFAAYSRASITAAAAAGKPRIAIIMTGLGLNESGTLDAIGALPDNVSLAFAPYGNSLSRSIAAARTEGHELFLQLPMEPFDYPDNDPGPETLLTGQPPRANLERLYWLMARFGGYAGVMNYMGARFTASNADFSPMMEELGTRGLGYIDDGSSNRSLALQLAGTNHVPFARADLQLDANPARAPILAALEKLEVEARASGSAIGTISALPVSIQTIAEWSRGLEGKGLLLVPASALMKQ